MFKRVQLKSVFLVLIVLLSGFLPELNATDYYYRVYLKDKGETGYTTENPGEYLSQKAVQRRVTRNVPVTYSDLPISTSYLDSLVQTAGPVITQSRWQSTVVVSTNDTLAKEKLSSLSFVDSVKWVWRGSKSSLHFERETDSILYPTKQPVKSMYGYGEQQIKMLKGQRIHNLGFWGEGITVAVIDDGFRNVDRISAFESLCLMGTKNIVNPGESVFESNDHGTKVLSCMAAVLPGVLIGTAPKASYWLIKSEDGRSEFPVEEDYWAAAVEFADSVGVDVITTSLGYLTFDANELNYHPSQLDGKTSFISRAASIAAEKGLLVFCSAGNEGNSRWGTITFPSDASGILTVGSVTEKKEKSNFSSIGFTADNRVKPDVSAMGSDCSVIDANGELRYANGTSFSTPTLAGLGICLWEAFPQLSNQDIVRLIQESAGNYKKPDTETGYGIPDLYKAYKKGRKYVSRLP